MRVGSIEMTVFELSQSRLLSNFVMLTYFFLTKISKIAAYSSCFSLFSSKGSFINTNSEAKIGSKSLGISLK